MRSGGILSAASLTSWMVSVLSVSKVSWDIAGEGVRRQSGEESSCWSRAEAIVVRSISTVAEVQVKVVLLQGVP